jgi:hypothetical protein
VSGKNPYPVRQRHQTLKGLFQFRDVSSGQIRPSYGPGEKGVAGNDNPFSIKTDPSGAVARGMEYLKSLPTPTILPKQLSGAGWDSSSNPIIWRVFELLYILHHLYGE